MNPYFYLKIKKYKNSKEKFNTFNLKKIISDRNNLKIFKKKQIDNKYKYKPFIFFCKKKINFKLSSIVLKFSLNTRKFNLWEKIDYLFHIYFFYKKNKWEDYTVFINSVESIKCLNVLYYLFYVKKKSKLLLEEQKNIKFWIWIFNINTNLTVYFHNTKSLLYKFIKYNNYRYKFFKKNFVKYNLSMFSLKFLSYILEENYKEKLQNSSKSKWNSEFKRLFNIQSCIKNNLKKNKYISYFSFYFRIKWKLMYFFYVVTNDVRTTKILHFWLFLYLINYIIETFFKQFKIKFNVFFLNVDSFKCLIKLFKFKKFNFKKKKKRKIVIEFDAKNFVNKLKFLVILTIKEIIGFFNLFVDKYLYNDFNNMIKKSKNYIHPELKILTDYIKNFFKK